MGKLDVPVSDAKVLIVDDVPVNLDVLCRTLEAEGYDVLVATSGEQAIEVCDRTHPDAILLDVMMPGIDGFETCRRLKANPEHQAIPVLFLTARDEMEGILEGFYAGGVDYVTKPFQQEVVLTRIQTHISNARMTRALAEVDERLEREVAERTRYLEQKIKELQEGKD